MHSQFGRQRFLTCPPPSSYYTKEPIQSTLESLAQGIRESFLTCNVEFAMSSTMYYVSRSFSSGKHIRVLTEEIEALARQHENLFGNSTSSDSPIRSPLLQFYLAPLYNALRDFENDNRHKIQEPLFPSVKVRSVDNYGLLKFALDQEQFACFHTVLSYQTAKEFIFRNMDSALKCADLYLDHFLVSSHVVSVDWLFSYALIYLSYTIKLPSLQDQVLADEIHTILQCILRRTNCFLLHATNRCVLLFVICLLTCTTVH